jgi:hypothetical protein
MPKWKRMSIDLKVDARLVTVSLVEQRDALSGVPPHGDDCDLGWSGW